MRTLAMRTCCRPPRLPHRGTELGGASALPQFCSPETEQVQKLVSGERGLPFLERGASFGGKVGAGLSLSFCLARLCGTQELVRDCGGEACAPPPLVLEPSALQVFPLRIEVPVDEFDIDVIPPA